MSELVLVAALLVASVVGHHGANQQATSWEDEDFFSHCPPSRCSQDGPEIRFPFRLNSSNTPSSCGLPCMKLACSGQDTILDNKYLGMPYKVTAIDYRGGTLTIIPLQDDNSLSSLCSHVKVIAATSSTAAVLVLLSMVATALYLSLKTRYDEEINLKVEMFLKTYGASKPTSPKISDFGLAKLCARDQSIVTLTAARGTMGYIAPELYSRNFGEISYKSDVYSFGMLVLEMVSGRRNSDPGVESQNEAYFPEWIYEQVATGQDLALTMEMTQEEKETVTQLAIVALWCIQWNPKNRPSMTKVVNMLTGRLQNLQVPPKPFFSGDSHPVPQTLQIMMS
ncbi:hypothetical protein GUJ93_ZPchr0001g31926 [Zizania palustris]|uniref:Protein kinase domain-containing protein n=1 Tax=Zizania palustris TaxID=103762 RepID=A0A8J5V844_ZIZPA|nr:hypothetical protein GUJ93_ZPchr0001g31926 [Zizania palustris]